MSEFCFDDLPASDTLVDLLMADLAVVDTDDTNEFDDSEDWSSALLSQSAAPRQQAASASATAPPTKLTKEDYVIVSGLRRLPYSATSLWGRNTSSLAGELTPNSSDEWAAVAEAQSKRAEFEANAGGRKLNVADLKKMVREAGRTCPSGITRGGMIDLLVAAGGVSTAIELDSDQTAVVNRWDTSEAKRTFIYAGPGAGKTTALCHYIQRAVNSGAQVLALAYNVVAEDTLNKRLKKLGVPRIPNTRLTADGIDASVTTPGCAVLTFDKLAYRMNSYEGSEAASVLDDPEVAGSSPLADSYRVSIESAALRAREGFGLWGAIVVDEGQDIMEPHAAIIEGLAATCGGKLVVAGDPRQELYSGARWFSEAWAAAAPDEKVTLRFNHRSSPLIVEVLNAFSRKNFPTLHCDQIAVCMPAPSDAPPFRVQCLNVRKLDRKTAALHVGEAVGEALAAGKPGESYAVAPVTTSKFGLGPASALARQIIVGRRPGVFVFEASVSDKLSGDYALATSLKVKGTERARVVVYGCDEDYKIVIDRGQLVRRMFVAMSRACDELIVIVRSQLSPIALEIMEPVFRLSEIELADLSVRPPFAGGPDLAIQVAGFGSELRGLCAVPGIELPRSACARSARKCETLPLGKAEGDADFMGVYAEALVLRALGMPSVTEVKIEINRDPATHCVRLVADPGVEPDAVKSYYFRVVVGPSAAGELQKVADRVRAAAKSSDDGNAAYHQAVLEYSLRIRREWTVSARLAQPEPEVREAAAAIAAVLRETTSELGARDDIDDVFRVCRSYPLRPLRDASFSESPLVSPAISYEPDAILGGIPVEIKHVNSILDAHRRQVAVYAALLGRPCAVLVNTADGSVELVDASDLQQVECAARAAIVCRTARQQAIGPLAKRAIRPPANLVPYFGCLVSVDTETLANGTVIEIGAVAYDANANAVLAVFNEFAAGVVETPDAVPPARSALFTGVEDLTGLTIVKHMTPDGPALERRFGEWLSRLPPRRAFLHWAGSERRLLDASVTWADIHRSVFLPWLEAGGAGRRDRTTLSDAVAQLMPWHLFAPHRAFEDAVATLGAYLSAVDTSTVL